MDISEEAVSTVSYNLHWRFGEESPYECRDITQTDASIYKDLIGDNGCIVIGGPPCQAYSLAGRAKLRSLGEHRKNINDKRGYLYQDYLRFIEELRPVAVVMENVPESTNYGGKNIPETVCRLLTDMGYNACWTILNAADYGVPQTRERVFVLAFSDIAVEDILLPQPTNQNVEPAQSTIGGRVRGFKKYPHFREPVAPTGRMPLWNTVKDAIDDLPVLFSSPTQKYSVGRINEKKAYAKPAHGEFQKLMRNWFDRETTAVSGNVFRKTVRDFPIFYRMKPGDNFQDASRIADQILEEEAVKAGITEADNPTEYGLLKKKIVPPYDRENFLYKWTKLDPAIPSHTLVAHLSVDTYSHIHPEEPRGISVREAARLQSFPDGYLFQSTMGDAYKQIGNAVPPLLSFAIANAMKRTIENNKHKEH